MQNGDAVQIKDLLKQVVAGNETAIEFAQNVLGDGTKAITVKLNGRQVNPEPPELPVLNRSPRRLHQFQGIDGFIAYLKKFGGADTVVLADVSSETMSAVLDENAKVGFEIIAFKPVLHPVFAPFAAILGKAQPLRAMVDFLSSNRTAISALLVNNEPQGTGRDLVRVLSQIKVSRGVEMWQGQGASSINGLKVTLNIAGESKERTLEMPEQILVDAPLYVSDAKRQFTLDVLVDADEKDGVTVKLTSGDLIQQRTEAFEGYCERLTKELAGTCTVGLGQPAYSHWETLTPTPHNRD